MQKSWIDRDRRWKRPASAKLTSLLTVLLISLFAGTALGQTITVSGEVIWVGDREPGRDPRTIGYSDCTETQQIEIPLTLAGTQGYTLQVWAGLSATCADNDERAAQEAIGRCWLVTSVEPTNRITLPVRGILPPVESTEPGAVCEQREEGSLTLYLLTFEGANAIGTGATIPFRYDLKGPAAPNLTGIGAGEGRLFPRWDPVATSDIVGYRVYCEESGPPDGSGAGGESGTESPDCPAPTLRAGTRPPEELRRGSSSSTGGTAEASGLSNGIRYACGVAGYDTLDNVGNLSNIECGTPAPVLDYFEAYRRAGGQAGGGFCRFSRDRASAAGALFMGIALGFVLRRRRALSGRQLSSNHPRSAR